MGKFIDSIIVIIVCVLLIIGTLCDKKSKGNENFFLICGIIMGISVVVAMNYLSKFNWEVLMK